jgi:hypothetical protein
MIPSRAAAQIRAFEDTWQWDISAALTEMMASPFTAAS